ncbi:hypothetical protein T4B_7816 [Trichinella pseudospiralis]|uniref:Uncharacterized protein n=1 Tax=Trichinella pseudospiralis TaxID=6337 RepID=A0A0V1HG42_TRIPS|nr:hypothetical protein T4B_7816 [Trichinella pseudospiralis]
MKNTFPSRRKKQLKKMFVHVIYITQLFTFDEFELHMIRLLYGYCFNFAPNLLALLKLHSEFTKSFQICDLSL